MDKTKIKRIGAILLIILLVGLYVAALILSFINSPAAYDMFKVCIILTIAVPVIIYAFKLMHKYMTNKDR